MCFNPVSLSLLLLLSGLPFPGIAHTQQQTHRQALVRRMRPKELFEKCYPVYQLAITLIMHKHRINRPDQAAHAIATSPQARRLKPKPSCKPQQTRRRNQYNNQENQKPIPGLESVAQRPQAMLLLPGSPRFP